MLIPEECSARTATRVSLRTSSYFFVIKSVHKLYTLIACSAFIGSKANFGVPLGRMHVLLT